MTEADCHPFRKKSCPQLVSLFSMSEVEVAWLNHLDDEHQNEANGRPEKDLHLHQICMSRPGSAVRIDTRVDATGRT